MAATANTIGGASTATTAPLPVASTIDGVNDYLAIYTASATATQGINRNTLLGLASQPLGLTDTQSPTNKTFNNTNSLTIKDTNLTIQDDGDVTKQVKFQLSGITTGTTRTLTVPDTSDTLVTLAATQTLTNKTLTAPVISGGSASNIALSVDTISAFTTPNTGTLYGISIASSVITTAGSVGSGANVTNGVQAAALATNAITLGYAPTTTNFTTSSTTPVQLTNLTSTVTIPAGGRKIKITVFLGFVAAGAAPKSTTISIWDGTVGSGTQLSSAALLQAAAAGNATGVVCYAVVTPSAGSKTYNVGVTADAGGGVTTTVASTSSSPSFILVEAI